jgi:hypothetical protein
MFSKLSVLLLLSRAWMWLLMARLGLSILSFRRLRPAFDFLTQATCHQTNAPLVSQLAWAVAATSRYVPRATCLTQALALHILLRRAGLESRIHIGVAKEDGIFRAHAWVESQEQVVIGNCDLNQYIPILQWD